MWELQEYLFVVGLMLFLAFNDIPQSNKDIFVSIIGMIVGSLSVVIYTIIGKNPDEVNALQQSRIVAVSSRYYGEKKRPVRGNDYRASERDYLKTVSSRAQFVLKEDKK